MQLILKEVVRLIGCLWQYNRRPLKYNDLKSVLSKFSFRLMGRKCEGPNIDVACRFHSKIMLKVKVIHKLFIHVHCMETCPNIEY